MKAYTVGSLLVYASSLCQCLASSNPFDVSAVFISDDLSNSSSSLNLGNADDPRFSVTPDYGENDLPVTPFLMNAVELLARYAEMDYEGRAPQRHGVVLPDYPQVEIAILPAAPTNSIQVRLVVWGLYDAVCKMADMNIFKENEITLRWEGHLIGHIYFTTPLDTPYHAYNQSINAVLPTTGGTIDTLQRLNMSTSPSNANTGRFDWLPIFKPSAKNVSPKDVFMIVLGALRSIAESPMTEKVAAAFSIGSPAVNANMQFYLHGRRSPRTRPPFFQYAHVLELLRRIPTWMLQQRRFAEAYFQITVNGIPVGEAVLGKGPIEPPLIGASGNISVF